MLRVLVLLSVVCVARGSICCVPRQWEGNEGSELGLLREGAPYPNFIQVSIPPPVFYEKLFFVSIIKVQVIFMISEILQYGTIQFYGTLYKIDEIVENASTSQFLFI